MMKARGRKKIAGKYWPFKTTGDWFPNTLWLVQHHSLQSLNPPDHKNTDYMKKDWTCSATQNTWKGSHTYQLPTGPITSTWKLNQLVASPGEGRSSSRLWITDTSLHIWTNWKTTNGLTIMHFYYKVKFGQILISPNNILFISLPIPYIEAWIFDTERKQDQTQFKLEKKKSPFSSLS